MKRGERERERMKKSIISTEVNEERGEKERENEKN